MDEILECQQVCLQKYWSANFHVFELLDWLEGQPTDVYVMDLKVKVILGTILMPENQRFLHSGQKSILFGSI